MPEIKDKELLDKEMDDGKNGMRPVWGQNPEFVTITMGGNDIGVLNLIVTCILGLKLWGMNCEEVIAKGHEIIDSQKFKDDADKLLQAIIDKGRKTNVGDKFKVFVLGYAKFFNQDTDQCDKVTFQPFWNLLDKKWTYLTKDRRKKANDLALALNKGLSVSKVLFLCVFGSFGDTWHCPKCDLKVKFEIDIVQAGD